MMDSSKDAYYLREKSESTSFAVVPILYALDLYSIFERKPSDYRTVLYVQNCTLSKEVVSQYSTSIESDGMCQCFLLKFVDYEKVVGV